MLAEIKHEGCFGFHLLMDSVVEDIHPMLSSLKTIGLLMSMGPALSNPHHDALDVGEEMVLCHSSCISTRVVTNLLYGQQ